MSLSGFYNISLINELESVPSSCLEEPEKDFC